jgi:hypothetical protein
MFHRSTASFDSLGALAGVALLAATILSQPALADIPIGRQNSTSSFGPSQTIIIFSNSANIKGIHLRTIAVQCYNQVNIIAVSPSAVSQTISVCFPPNVFGTQQAIGLYLPPGWGLEASSGGYPGNGGANTIFITYD